MGRPLDPSRLGLWVLRSTPMASIVRKQSLSRFSSGLLDELSTCCQLAANPRLRLAELADELLFERQSQLPAKVLDPEILALLPFCGQHSSWVTDPLQQRTFTSPSWSLVLLPLNQPSSDWFGRISTQGSPSLRWSIARGKVVARTFCQAALLQLPTRSQISWGGGSVHPAGA